MDQPFWPSDGLTESDLLQILNNGQAFFMLDGLDEIGDIGRRKALRKAVIKEGLSGNPDCVWMLSSRVVGYEDVSFHDGTLIMKEMLSSLPSKEESENDFPKDHLIGIPNVYYLLPLTEKQIQTFIERWYNFREADKSIRQEKIKDLIEAVFESESIISLAHNPNLLTMISLIHRVYAKLPSGRAFLYDKITEAYLESIDDFRKIRESVVTMNKHRLWMGKLAFNMQMERHLMEQSKNDNTDSDKTGNEILIEENKVKAVMQQFLADSVDIEKELSYIARRSGLLIPRKPGFYSFVHLSFQEYFAALHLYERLMSFDGREETANIVVQFRDKKIWHECLIFLFEKLSEHQGASDWLFDRLFSGDSFKSETVFLATNLLINIHSGLNIEKQKLISMMVLMHFNTHCFDQRVLNCINKMSEETWKNVFFPSINCFLQQLSDNQSEVKPELIIFLQHLNSIDLNTLFSLINQFILPYLKPNEVYFLHPLLVLENNAIFTHLLDIMPLELWLYRYGYSAPIYFFGDEFPDIQSIDKIKLLNWISSFQMLFNCIFLKLLLLRQTLSLFANIARVLSLSKNLTKGQDLALILDQALFFNLEGNSIKNYTLDLLSFSNVFQKIKKVFFNNISKSLSNTIFETLNKDRTIVLGKERDQALKQVFRNEKNLKLILKKTINSSMNNELPIHIQTIHAAISGNDNFELPDNQNISTTIQPF